MRRYSLRNEARKEKKTGLQVDYVVHFIYI